MSAPQLPVRVLYCESSADGTIGGSHYCLVNLVEHLDRRRFEPVVVFYEEHAILGRFQAAAETIVHPQDRAVRWNGALRPFGMAVNRGRFLATVAQHVSLIRQRRIGLVHLNNSITRHQDWMLAAFIAGVPVIVHERGLNARYTAVDRWYATRAAAIVPMSAWIRDHMVERGVPADNIRVMYDGLDPALLRPSRSPAEIRAAFQVAPHQRLVGIVGNVRPWKGQETVVRAVIEVARTHPEVVCLIVGNTTPQDVEYKAKLEALIAGAGAGENFRFTGYQKDVPSFVNAMEFQVHASVAPEPFGMVVLEGMAQRKAVLGAGAGGPVEMILNGVTGYTYPPGDPQALAARMTELLEHPDACRRMGEAGYQRLVQDFTLDRYMERIHALYDAVLTGGRLPSDMTAAMMPPAA